MSKLCEKEKKISKSQITDNDLVSNSSKLYKYTYLLEPVFQNNIHNNTQNNKIYKKPFLKLNENTNSNFINNSEDQYFIENNPQIYEHKINDEQIKNNKIKEIENNLIKNDNKLENVNKAIEEIMSKNNKDQNTTEIYNSKMNDLENLKQENLTLKADAIIYREDILHLSEINKKLKEELDIVQKKIFDLISKGEEFNHILNNKNYEISLLTESISNLKLTNCQEMIQKFKNNKTKEQKIYELEFELNGLNNDKIILETEIKNLEKQYNNLIEEKNKNDKEEQFYKNRISENIFGLEEKIKKLGKQMEDLEIINKELKMKNQKNENNIIIIKNEKNNLMDKYEQKKDKYNELEKEYKKLENKYSQLLYDIQKRNFIEENEKNQEVVKKSIKKDKSSKQLIINDLYNKIKDLKENIKNERKYND